MSMGDTSLRAREAGSNDSQRSTPPLNPLQWLGPNSYTARRLQHATPEHLHLTTRRCFIGPIPEGWLKSHRRDWYRHHLHIHYSSRSAAFDAPANTSKHRHVDGIAGDQASKTRNRGVRVQGNDTQDVAHPRQLAEQHIEEEESEEELAQDGDTVHTPDDKLPSAALDIPTTQNHTRALPVRSKLEDHKKPSIERLSSESGGPIQPSRSSDSASSSLNSSKASPSLATSVPRTRKSTRSKLSRGLSASSFVTAHESLPGSRKVTDNAEDASHRILMDGFTEEPDGIRRASTVDADTVGTAGTEGTDSRTDSTIALLKRDKTRSKGREESPEPPQLASSPEAPKKKARFQDDTPLASVLASGVAPTNSAGLVRFNLPEDEDARGDLLKVRLAQNRRRDTFKRLRHGNEPQGEIVKMEKMLVRVEVTYNQIGDEYDENDSQKIDSRVVDKWREFMVVCRESTGEDEEYVLQMYKSRIIPATDKTHVRKDYAHLVSLNKKRTKINIYSSLDKTVVIWEPYKKGTRMYIMKPRSGASAMTWFTFLRGLLGGERSSVLQINVPDLSVSLRIDHPFENLENSQNLVNAAQGDEEALVKTVEEEHAVANNLIVKCMGMLEKSPEWGNVIDEWALHTGTGSDNIGDGQHLSHVATAHHTDRPEPALSKASSRRSLLSQLNGHRPIGLAWKRYDRLEWVHGGNEKNMYGTIGMEKFHDLELRPKQHYPTTVRNAKKETLIEPPAVEGFLIRLTSQKGTEQKLGKLFFKRLYFSTHSQFLVFNRPSQADPPPPPKMPLQDDSNTVPSAHQIAETVPLIYAVNPYPVDDGQLAWLDDQSTLQQEEVVAHDQEAFDENQRKINNLLRCDGLINMTNVKIVRRIRRGATPADQGMDEGPDVEFHQAVEDSRHEDGATYDVDDERTFELVLRNDLIIRLQAFDKTTCEEWMQRLRALVEYWTARIAADMALYKWVRKQNLDALRIDEEQEAFVGQFAHKWEVNQSFASPELYNMCGISCCRTIMMAGTLFRKPRLHATFRRCHVVLSHGHLLVFQDAVRSKTGELIKHIHHERVTAIDLSECYIYSGLVTTDDMLYNANDGYEKARPGHQGGLPKMYLEDGWSSTDEDTMTSFVIWHGKRKGWYRSEGTGDRGGARSKLRLVGQLGKEGRRVVFKTRSRAERDHWVMSIGLEIERLSQSEAVRIVDKK